MENKSFSRFSKEQIESFLNQLNLKRVALTEIEHDLEVDALSKPEDHPTGERVLPTDQGVEEMAREVSLRLAEGELNELREINNAMIRLKSGTFGECEECGISIPVKRLEVIPETRFCVQCEELLEEAEEAQNPRAYEVDFDKPVIKPEI